MNEQYFSPEFQKRFNAFCNDAPGNCNPVLGIQSPEQFKQFRNSVLRTNREAADLLGRPGSSLMERGKAAIVDMSPEVKAWAATNASAYGLKFNKNNPWYVTPIGEIQKERASAHTPYTEEDFLDMAWGDLFTETQFADAGTSGKAEPHSDLPYKQGGDFDNPIFSSRYDLEGSPLTSAGSRERRELQESPQLFNENVRDIIARNETYLDKDGNPKPELVAYRDGDDSDGSPRYSIGYGTKSYEGEKIDEAEALKRFKDEYDKHAAPLLTGNAISNFYELPMDLQYGLIDFTYNMGDSIWTHWEDTKKLIEELDFFAAAAEFDKDWNIEFEDDNGNKVYRDENNRKHPRVQRLIDLFKTWGMRLNIEAEQKGYVR